MNKLPLYWNESRRFLKTLANLSTDTDIDATVNSIEKGVEFKGANVWILFFAIIIASVGLNVNSTAVIIGAMLVSPLMGPINGIGLAVGVNDSALLKRSLQNLIVMVLISLTASTAYFFISPLNDAQSELLARTSPTIYDVFIAVFGGFAGIVASSRKEGKITIISGVAIATALMPPLCTAGFGLATGQYNFFLGAFYLFFINSFFIALATFVMVRYMHFPMKQYIDASRQKIVRRTITAFSIIVIVPSVFVAWNMIAETRFDSKAIHYVQDIQKEVIFDEIEIISMQRNYSRKEKEIALSLVGKTLEQNQIEHLQRKLHDYGLADAKLSIKQTGGTIDVNMQANVLSKLLDRKDEQLQRKDETIMELNSELEKMKLSGIDNLQIAREIAAGYPNVKRFSVSNQAVYTDVLTGKSDTVPTLLIEWMNPNDTVNESKLIEWLKVRLSIETLKVIDEN